MSIDKPTHKDLVEECCFYEGFYSLSFRDRIMYDLGYVKITSLHTLRNWMLC